MTKYILWDPERETLGPHEPDYFCEIDLAKNVGINLFDGANEIITDPRAGSRIAQDPRKKVVIKHWRNCVDPVAQPEDLSWADLVILYSNDVITGPWSDYQAEAIKSFRNEKFICVVEGCANMTDHPVDLLYEDHEYHSSRIVDFCRYEDWNIIDPKPKLFDALIGSTHPIIKPHRIFLFDQLKKSGLIDQSFVNIWGARNYRSPDLKEYDDTAIDNYRNSVLYNDRYKNGRSMSHSIPIEIYRHSWYSIVAETMANKSNYLTEKTSKPLFEKKIFVMFGAQGILGRLRELGYKTFDGIIDESYDLIDNPNERWNMAFNEVLKLADADHKEIYKRAESILEHNHRWIIDNHYPRLLKLKNFLDRHINNL